MKKENRKVRLENGALATFTQRGLDATAGFIRINGRTISGYLLTADWQRDSLGNPAFYANADSPNGYLASY